MTITPVSSVNLISGLNGSGKTSILEAIFYCSTAQSFRGVSDDQLKMNGCDVCRLDITGVVKNSETRVEIAWGSNHKKQVKVDGVRQVRLSSLFDCFHAVSFIPEDTELVLGSPAVRRRMLDIYISQLDRSYLSSLIEYKRVISQRNALLKEFALDDDFSRFDSLEVWDDQLAAIGSKIVRRRIEMVASTRELLKGYYNSIDKNGVCLDWNYSSTIDLGDDLQESFLKKLKSNRKRDLYLGATSVGPHRDDLLIELGSTQTRGYVSQGEAKSVALAIKFTLFAHLRESLGEAPILLLDELSSDLDEKRFSSLIGLLPDLGQVFLTAARPGDLAKAASIKAEIKVEGGKLVS